MVSKEAKGAVVRLLCVTLITQGSNSLYFVAFIQGRDFNVLENHNSTSQSENQLTAL